MRGSLARQQTVCAERVFESLTYGPQTRDWYAIASFVQTDFWRQPKGILLCAGLEQTPGM